MIRARIRRITDKLSAAAPWKPQAWARFARRQVQLGRVCTRRLLDNNVMAMSSALSFRTIFAMVPTLILAFLVLRSMGMIKDTKSVLREVLQQSGFSQIAYGRPDKAAIDGPSADGAPETAGEPSEEVTVAGKLEAIVTQVEGQLTVGRLGPVGGALLVWAAITLLTTMERSLNRIFGARRSRKLSRRVLLYWSAVTLAPLALAVMVFAVHEITRVCGGFPLLAWVIKSLGWLGTVGVGVFLLAWLYKLLPNTLVRFRSALWASAAVVPVWLVARWGFALYVNRVGRNSIYGSIGLVPLFLLWLNLSWWIFLFGAEMAHSAADVSRMRGLEKTKDMLPGPWHLLASLLAVARRYAGGAGPSSGRQVADELGITEQLAEDLLSRLAAQRILCRVESEEYGAYSLAKPADKILVTEVLRIGYHLDEAAAGAAMAEAIGQVRRRSEAGIDKLTVAEVISV